MRTNRVSPRTIRCNLSNSAMLSLCEPASPMIWPHRAARFGDGRSPSIENDDAQFYH